MRKTHRFSMITAFVAVLTIAMAGLALADNVVNDVQAGGNDTITAGGSTTINYWIVATGGDGQAGCNASDGTAATMTINAPAAVTASPSSLVFTDCGTGHKQAVTFTSSTAGEYHITVSVSDTGPGSYNTTSGGFTLYVTAPSAPADTTPPTITITTPADGAVYILNQDVRADYACADEDRGSGLASCVGPVASGAAIDTASVGSKSFTVDAADNAGNTSSKTHSYSVHYAFGGWQAPVNALPIRNTVKAGRAIPIKFSLGGDQGMDIFNGSGPKVSSFSCDTAPTDPVEETLTAGGSSLQYDASTDTYTYVWKSDTKWANKCMRLGLNLKDGSSHHIDFGFTK